MSKYKNCFLLSLEDEVGPFHKSQDTPPGIVMINSWRKKNCKKCPEAETFKFLTATVLSKWQRLQHDECLGSLASAQGK